MAEQTLFQLDTFFKPTRDHRFGPVPKKRFEYALLFKNGLTVRQIADKYGVGICAVNDGLRHANVDFQKHFGLKKTLTDIQLAYIAGLIDGEGCISIHIGQDKRGRKRRFDVWINISNTDVRMLAWLKATVGAGDIHVASKRVNPRWNTAYGWRVTGRYAADLLRLVKDYLVIKTDQAEIALEFQTLKTTRRGRKHDDEMLRKYLEFKHRIEATRLRPKPLP